MRKYEDISNNKYSPTLCEKNVYRMAFDNLSAEKQSFLKEILDMLYAKEKEGMTLSKNEFHLLSNFYFNKW